MKLLLALLLLVAASCSAPPRSMPERITGPVTEVRFEGGEVTRFTVARGAEELEVLIQEGHDYGFDLGHLEEHRTAGDPVVVDLVWREGEAYATAILDA